MNEFSSIVTEGWRHKLFMDGFEIDGIQSISFNQPLQLETYNYLGTQPLTKYNGNKVASISIKKQLFNKDKIFTYTGQSRINGFILENNSFGINNLGFTSGYLTSYSLNVTKNQPIEVDANISIFGDYGQMDGNEYSLFNYHLEGISGAPQGYIFCGPVRSFLNFNVNIASGNDITKVLSTGDYAFLRGGTGFVWSGMVTRVNNGANIQVNTIGLSAGTTTKIYKKKQNKQISANSINISLDEFSTNRVNSFNMSISLPRVPVYALGQSLPYEINSVNPLNVNCSFEIEMDGYQFQKTKLYPTGFYRFQNALISIKDYTSGIDYMTFNLNNLSLTSHDYSIEAGGTAKVQLNYIGQM